MYHGEVVPGFPEHPHRGFETVTIARWGLVDHADSLGAAARYGNGDVQWLTAGRGIVHAEMFPLLNRAAPNPLDLYQIWLNLPAHDKFVEPHFSMFWAEHVPHFEARDANFRVTRGVVVAGTLEGKRPPAPPPHSWASRAESDILIATLEMQAGARFTLPPAHPESHRAVYFVRGKHLSLGSTRLEARSGAEVMPARELLLENGSGTSDILILQGRPIGEPVVKRGPFVMNSADEIRQAYIDYQQTRFGGWPWPSRAPLHGMESLRFARHADGRLERAGEAPKIGPLDGATDEPTGPTKTG